jgi:hypothetical protein
MIAVSKDTGQGVLDPLLLPDQPGLACRPKRRKGSCDFVKDFGLVGYPGIIAAVLLQAQLDAEGGDTDALNWLLSDLADDFCIAVGFNARIIPAWILKKKLHRKR